MTKMFARKEPLPTSAFGRGVARLAKDGLHLPGKPDYDAIPELQDDLGDVADEALMEYWSALVEWTNYIAVKVTQAEIEEEEAESALATEKAKYMVLNPPAKGKVTETKAQRDASELVAELDQELLERHAYRKMLSTLFDNTERKANLISRELSRRIGLAPAQGRKAWMRT